MKYPLSFDGTKLNIQLPEDAGIIVFDSFCVLCSSTIAFLTHLDKHQKLYYTSFETQTGRELSKALPPDLDSLIFYKSGFIYVQSDAVVKIIESLHYPWRAFSVIRLVPAVIRESLYRFIARIRYKVFGRKDQCTLPSPETGKRFIK